MLRSRLTRLIIPTILILIFIQIFYLYFIGDFPSRLLTAFRQQMSHPVSPCYGVITRGVPGSFSFSPDSKILAASSGKSIELWEIVDQQHVGRLLWTECAMHSTAFSPDGRRLAAVGYGTVIAVWDLKSRKLVARLNKHTKEICSIAFSPDGKLLASVAEDQKIMFWDAMTYEVRGEIDGVQKPLQIQFSPDSTKIAVRGRWEVTLWDVLTRKQLTEFPNSSGAWCIAYSPEGSKVAAVITNEVTVWNLLGKKINSFKLQHDIVYRLSYSNDARLLFSVGDTVNNTAVLMIHDADTGVLLHTFYGGSVCFTDLAISPNGKYAVTSKHFGSTMIWILPTLENRK